MQIVVLLLPFGDTIAVVPDTEILRKNEVSYSEVRPGISNMYIKNSRVLQTQLRGILLGHIDLSAFPDLR